MFSFCPIVQSTYLLYILISPKRKDKKNREEKWLKTLAKFCYRTWIKRIFESHDKDFFSIGSNPIGVSYLMTRHITLLSARNTISYFFTASIFQIKTYYIIWHYFIFSFFFCRFAKKQYMTCHLLHQRPPPPIESYWKGLNWFKPV